MDAYLGSNKRLPSLVFNPASSLGMATEKLSFAPVEKTDGGSVKESVKILVENFNDPLNRIDFQTLKSIASSYTTSVVNSFNYLQFIKNSVDDIKSKIDTTVNQIAAKSEIISQAQMSDADNYKSEFVMMPWDDISKLGSAGYVVDHIRTNLNLFADKKTTDVVIDTNSVAMVYNALQKHIVTTPIDSVRLSSDQLNTVIDFCHNNGNITRDNVIKYLPSLLSKDAMGVWITNVYQRVRLSGAIDTIDTISDIRNMNEIVTLIEKKECLDKLNLSDSQMKQFNQNVNLGMTVLCFEYFFVAGQRKRNKEVLVFGTNLLNPDAVPTFRKEGFDLIDISKFLSSRNITQVPPDGYETKVVSMAVKNVRQDLQIGKESLVRLATVKLNEIKKDAFVHHVSDFMNQLTVTPKIGNMTRYIEHMADDVVGLNGDLDSGIYGIIINGEYPGTVIQSLYERLGKAYVNVLSNTQNVSQSDMSEAEVSSVVDIIVDHMLEKLIDGVQ